MTVFTIQSTSLPVYTFVPDLVTSSNVVIYHPDNKNFFNGRQAGGWTNRYTDTTLSLIIPLQPERQRGITFLSDIIIWHLVIH